jgi:excisionase family DNA binding protein
MAPTNPSRRLVSIEKAAAYVDASPRTIRRSIAAGKLTGYRFGNRLLRIDLNEVDSLLRPIPVVHMPDEAAAC